ncbi:hypothetical protein TrRE_jg4440 [Triparma retinervis]|uniref:Uncharacterized protein n=1 Tax=Triparma retinervis TaxID=2557542 RepID=A0A9W7AQI4_9STRA|nr:hypothetical protein TrRE_jg4440 [Triparma retinervis]
MSKGSITPSPLFNITISSSPRDVTFALSDSIIAERWYSVSPEIISRAMSGYLVHVSPPAASSPLALYVDPFAGVGQDTVSLSKSLAARSSPHVIFSCDLDLNCLLTTSYNLSLQKVPTDSVVLVWCNSVALARSLPTNFDYSVNPSSAEARTKEGFRLVRFGPQPETSSADDFKSLWPSLPTLEVTSGASTEVRGVFLSPPWNNTGYYDRGGRGRFSLQDDVVIKDGEGADVTGMEVVDEWRAKVAKGGAVCTFVPSTWDPTELQRGSSGRGRTEVYRHLLNGKHKTGCVYFVK